MRAHSLPIVLGRRTGVPQAQRLCQRCSLHALLMRGTLCLSALPCSCVGPSPCLFPDKNTMQQCMWQPDIVGWLTTSWIVVM